MPGNNSWNGVDTGKRDDYFIFRKVDKEKAKEIVGKSFDYDFGDGWRASISVTENKRSKSAGFRGYDWMVSEILKHGRILTREERKK